MTAITAAVDMADVVTGLFAVGAVLVLPSVAKAGIRRVLAMIR